MRSVGINILKMFYSSNKFFRSFRVNVDEVRIGIWFNEHLLEATPASPYNFLARTRRKHVSEQLFYCCVTRTRRKRLPSLPFTGQWLEMIAVYRLALSNGSLLNDICRVFTSRFACRYIFAGFTAGALSKYATMLCLRINGWTQFINLCTERTIMNITCAQWALRINTLFLEYNSTELYTHIYVYMYVNWHF
jgi:hypothetical protein